MMETPLTYRVCSLCGLLKAQPDHRLWCVDCTLKNRDHDNEEALGVGDNDHPQIARIV